jgi:beta-lactam-binding protein with PASTA domain
MEARQSFPGDTREMTDRPSEMPRVWQLSFDQAQQALHGLGLAFAINRAQSDVVPEGTLMAVSPPPGTSLDDGTTILVTVSTGPPRRKS